MAVNQQGIAISIKAFLPMGRALDDQLAALNLVKTAHETGDYAALLAASQDVEVKTEQKTRRVDPIPVVSRVVSEEPQPAPAPDPGETTADMPADPEPEETPLPLDPTPATGKKKGNGNE